MNSPRRKPCRHSVRGAIVVATAVSMTVLLMFAALTVDMGHVFAVQSEVRRTADAAALAGATMLASDGSAVVVRANATAAAIEYAARNTVEGAGITLDPERDIEFGWVRYDRFTGRYNYTPISSGYPNGVRVIARRTQDSNNGPVVNWFARLLGIDTTDVAVPATATLMPRDIALCVDLSASMNDDSEVRNEPSYDINIAEIWEDLGSPTFGQMNVWHDSAQQMPVMNGSSSSIVTALGLDTVPYPAGAGGSWSNYVSYVKTLGGNIPGETVYRNRYGLRTWINYLNDAQYTATQSPVLASTRQQPLYAVKQAVVYFAQHLEQIQMNDRLSLTTFSSSAHHEIGLTDSYLSVAARMYSRQAGHYGSGTNVGAGINQARQELFDPQTSRFYANKVLILLTDGRPNEGAEGGTPQGSALQQAQHAADDGVTIHTIGLGSGADQELLQQIANIAYGEYFYVENNDPQSAQDNLMAVFQMIGGHRMPMLIE